MIRALSCVLSIALLCAAALPRDAVAQAYPAKPIRLVVPFAAGGPTDTTGRILAERMAALLGVPIVVENKPGASTQIGAEYLINAAPDGYTFMLMTISTALTPLTNKGFNVDLTKQLTPISRVMDGPTVVSVTSKIPVTTFGEFLAYAKANPGKLNFGSQGASDVLGNELFKAMAGADIVTIRYSGGAPASRALLAGEVHYMFMFPGVSKPLVDSGDLRAVAVTGLSRLAAFPNVPTVSEAGLNGFEFTSWSGLVGPPRMPRPFVDKLHEATVAALKTPSVRTRLEGLGFVLVGSTPEEFGRYFAAETAKWTQVAQRAGFKPE